MMMKKSSGLKVVKGRPSFLPTSRTQLTQHNNRINATEVLLHSFNCPTTVQLAKNDVKVVSAAVAQLLWVGHPTAAGARS